LKKTFTAELRKDSGKTRARFSAGGIREYWSLGEKVATAYQDGKKHIP